MKVVWLCNLSSPEIRSHLRLRKHLTEAVQKASSCDFGQWNLNAVNAFQEFTDIDLTVIIPFYGIRGVSQRFKLGRVQFICFRPEDDQWWLCRIKRLRHLSHYDYIWSRGFVARQIRRIRPDIVHLIGAENPPYSVCALDVPRSIPLVVSLQTLLNVPDFLAHYPMDPAHYAIAAQIEKQVLKRANYLWSGSPSYRELLPGLAGTGAPVMDRALAVGEEPDRSSANKEYDFVYFSAYINKAADWAVEAFALAVKSRPHLKLNISGQYDEPYRAGLQARIDELGIASQVFITGAQASHDDVKKQVRKSRFALLPLKVDLISGTVREAMAWGLPVVSTITPGTPALNETRRSILLSAPGDFEAMAQNMILLADDASLATSLRENAYETVEQLYGNTRFMRQWRDSYKEIMAK